MDSNQSTTMNVTPLPPSTNNVVNNLRNSNDDVNKLIKVTNKKLNKSTATTTATTAKTKSDRFGGTSNKLRVNKTATIQPSTNQVKLSPPPFITSNAKMSNNTLIVPKVATQNVGLNRLRGGEKKAEIMQHQQPHHGSNQMVVGSKNVSKKKPIPPTLSLAPPPPLHTADDNKQGNLKVSWASLFSSSASTNKATSLPHPFDNTKRSIAKVFPFEGSPVTPPTQNNGSISYSAASAQGLQAPAQNTALPQKSTVEKKAVADKHSLKLATFLQNYKINNSSISISPRGLINKAYYCYLNAILQTLVSCPPFYHLMRDIPKPPPYFKAKGCTPIMDAMQRLIIEFQPRKVVRENATSAKDTAFEPTAVHKILNRIFQVEGRQEDAEEFLGSILNRLDDEMLEIIKLSEKPPVAIKQPITNQTVKKEEIPNVNHNGENTTDADEDDWQAIDSKNKDTITRTAEFGRTPISDIFRGKLCSRVIREGDHHSTENIQPFFTLPLDIKRAKTVNEALDLLCGRDPLEGITSSKTNQEVTAWQQVTIEELPIVLVLHLKYFNYRQGRCTKILKPIEFPIELKIETKLLTSKTKYTIRQRTYKLFAVVYHDGKEASKGHYLADAFHIDYSSWIRYDDCTVKLVTDNQVLKPISPTVPYLLYYRRCDTINGPNNNSNNNSQQQNYHHK